MLRDLTRSDWLSILGIPAERVPAVLILRGTRNLLRRYEAMLPFFDDVLEVGAPNGIFEDVLIGRVGGVDVGYASVYGASMASEITHVFGVLGTTAVIQIGNCGGLANELQAGDLFVAEAAFCGEGAAQYYKSDGPWVQASADLTQRIGKACVEQAAGPPKRGKIFTTAALLAESATDLERWAADGFGAVDMETATTFAVAEHFGMKRAALLYVFDNPRRREHLLLTDAEKDVRREAANEAVIRLALRVAGAVGRENSSAR
ncbi:MAG: hypothetical protein U0793_06580 [Gemmataceae bacterium]